MTHPVVGGGHPHPFESATAFYNWFCSDLQFPNISTFSLV